MIDKFGEERFKALAASDSRYSKYQDPEFVAGEKWIFTQFMNIWQNCGYDSFSGARIITFATINEYVECMKVPLTVAEKKLLLKMKHWADETIAGFDAPAEKQKT